MRRAEIGHHHHIAGAYLLRYAQEASWREDNRRVANGDQVSRVAGLAMSRSRQWISPATGSATFRNSRKPNMMRAKLFAPPRGRAIIYGKVAEWLCALSPES